MKYKNVLHSCLLILAILFLVSLANAEESSMPVTSTSTSDSSPGGALKVRKTEIKNEIQNLQNDKEGRRDTINQLKKDLTSITGRIVNGTVTAVNGTSFTVSNKERTFTVTTDSNTKCERHYFGTCSLSEIAVNNKVNVWGNFTDETRTTLQARVIRDASIMKKRGTFMGDVTSKGETSFVIKSRERGDQTVNFTSTTQFMTRIGVVMTYNDLQVGNRVMVSGVWDKTNNTVSEVSKVKDFSLPIPVDKRVPPTATTPATTP